MRVPGGVTSAPGNLRWAVKQLEEQATPAGGPTQQDERHAQAGSGQSLAFLQSLWEHWFGHPSPEVWWTLEYSSDWRWNTLFATAVHALYCIRYAVILGEYKFHKTRLAILVKSNLTAILDVVARRPKGLTDHGSKWIRPKPGEDPTNEKARMEVCISFPFP